MNGLARAATYVRGKVCAHKGLRCGRARSACSATWRRFERSTTARRFARKPARNRSRRFVDHPLPPGPVVFPDQSPAQGRLEEADAPGMFRLPVVPIKDFTPYLQRCRLCVRVTSKSGVRAFRNARTDGKLFSMDFMDIEGSATRATVFNASAFIVAGA